MVLEAETAALNAEAATLKTSLAAAEARANSLETNFAKTEAQLNNTQRDLAAEKKQREAAEAKAGTLGTELTTVKGVIDELRARLQEAQSAAGTTNGDV